VSFAERALLENENQILVKQNDKAKRRESTKATVLGRAKVISFKDLKEARVKRIIRDVEISKGKRGRKRKSILEQGIVARKTQKARRSELEIAKDEIAAARMTDHYLVLQL